jgi:hypothetical protein
LKRPRDIIRIGRALAHLDHEDRTVSGIRECITREGTRIARDYIKIFLPHTEFEDEAAFLAFLQTIPHNILDGGAMRRICSMYQGGCPHLAKASCLQHHPFSDLYRLGLLGVVRFDLAAREMRQHFLTPGEAAVNDPDLSPDPVSIAEDHYLIHPVLYDLLGGTPATRVNMNVTVGDRKPWKTPEQLPPFVTKYRMFISYAGDDRPFVEKLAADLNERKITCWYDRNNMAVGESFYDHVLESMESCKFLGVVVSENTIASSWVAQEIEKAIQLEITSRDFKILPILVEGDHALIPAGIRDKQFADFRTDYEAGIRQLCHRLAGIASAGAW